MDRLSVKRPSIASLSFSLSVSVRRLFELTGTRSRRESWKIYLFYSSRSFSKRYTATLLPEFPMRGEPHGIDTLEAVRKRAKGRRSATPSEKGDGIGEKETERRAEQVRIYTCWWILKRTSYPRHFYWPSLRLFSSPPPPPPLPSRHPTFVLVTSRTFVLASFFNPSLPPLSLSLSLSLFLSFSRSESVLTVSCELNTSKRGCCVRHNCKVKSNVPSPPTRTNPT